MVIRPLAAREFDVVHAAFTEAFSDYVVPLTLTREQFEEMMTRRGWVPEASIGVFDDERLVAFTLNGIDGTRAYDTGSGVVPSHRRRGLARQTLTHGYPLLREHGCTEYVLEVLENNARAEALYRSEGFMETRRLQSWRYECSDGLQPVGGSRPVGGLKPAATFIQEEWWDIEPSWQNSTHSIERARDRHEILGNDDGYVVVFPKTGDVPQLAVRPEARRKGLGTQLLHAAAALADKPLRIINLDDRGEGIAQFLEKAGATHLVRQIEMVLPLG